MAATTYPNDDESDFSTIETLTIVGLGLIGGSIASAARARGLAKRIVAVGRKEADLQAAVEANTIDGYELNLAAAAKNSDLTILATPVDVIVAQLSVALENAKPGSLVTDAGSTKRVIVEAGESIPSPATFVGSHPMAGSDKGGWRNSCGELFESASAVVAITEKTDLEAAARVSKFWEALGSRVIFAEPSRHDDLVALVSHLPHMAASLISAQLADCGEDPALLRQISGMGLRDTTRVAMGDSRLWLQICRQNKTAVVDSMRAFAGLATEAADLLEQGEDEALVEMLARAAAFRRRLDE